MSFSLSPLLLLLLVVLYARPLHAQLETGDYELISLGNDRLNCPRLIKFSESGEVIEAESISVDGTPCSGGVILLNPLSPDELGEAEPFFEKVLTGSITEAALQCPGDFTRNRPTVVAVLRASEVGQGFRNAIRKAGLTQDRFGIMLFALEANVDYISMFAGRGATCVWRRTDDNPSSPLPSARASPVPPKTADPTKTPVADPQVDPPVNPTGPQPSASASSKASPAVSGSVSPDVSGEPTSEENGPITDINGEPSASDEDDDVCFPASARVELRDGRRIPMSHVRIGDHVRVSTTAFSPVFAFTHRDGMVQYRFHRITHTHGGKPLVVTGSHFVYKADGTLVAARELRVGDALRALQGDSRISKVDHVTLRGLFNPQTVQGDIVVEDVRASTYTLSMPPPAAHALLAPVRAVFRAVHMLGANSAVSTEL